MRYLLKYGAALSLLALTLSSCREEPDYPNEPEIEFERVDVEYVPVVDDDDQPTGVTTALMTIVVKYKDGDGNLGLNPLEVSTNPTDPDSQAPFNSGSDYENNFILDLYQKLPVPGSTTDSAFVKYKFPIEGFDFSGRFRRLSTDDRIEPLEGEIRYTLTGITSEFFETGDVLKFQIFIYDRTTPVPNKSNTVETTPIKLNFD